MSEAVDERIVAAKFDATEFEKGVDKTIKKLDELKKSLNFTEISSNVKEFADKAEKSTKSLGDSFDRLSDRLTTFTGMVKQKLLSGIADEVVAVFFKMENAVKSFIKGIGSDQISEGMNKYESLLTSVRVMVSAGQSEKGAYEALSRAQEYSDQTSYSFAQMSDSMSKMVAAGVELGQAEKNVEGIANACANAGINAQTASRAFYNLSQAYSTGYLHYTDYRSLELMNLTTVEFKNQMLEAAVAAGTLEKVSDGVYRTINKNDKKVVAGKKVTAKNIGEALKYNFINTTAMNKLFGENYYMDILDPDEMKALRKELGDAEFEKRYGKIAITAYNAAREARTFTDVINALKDAVSTGWSDTFTHLFGKLNEAKDFFTALVDDNELADFIYSIGEYRNAVLGSWNEEDAFGRGTGGVLFRESILNITDIIGNLLGIFRDAMPNSKSLGESLKILTARFRQMTIRVKDAVISFREWMNEAVDDKGTTRIERLRNIITNLGSVFKIVGNIIGTVFTNAAKILVALSPVFDGLAIMLEKLTEPIKTLSNNDAPFKSITYSVENLITVLQPLINFLGSILAIIGDIGAFFISMGIDTFIANITFLSDAFGLFMEIFTGSSSQLEHGEGILEGIRKDFEAIKNACKEGLTALKDFFGALLGDLKVLLGLGADENAEEGGIFSGVVNFFKTNEFVQKAKKWIEQAFIDIGDFIKSIPSRLVDLGLNIFEVIRGIFYYDETKYNGSMLETKTYETPFKKWIDQAIIDIAEFIKSIPDRIIKGIGAIGDWVNEIFDSIFNPKNAKTSTTKSKDNKKDVIIKRFNEFISNISNSVRQWFADLPNKIRSALKWIGNFATRIFNAIDEFLFGKKMKVTKDSDLKGKTFSSKAAVARYKTGFSKWLDTIIKEVEKIIKNIPEYIKSAIIGIGDILSQIISAIFGKKDGTEITSKDLEDRIKKPFLGIDINNILNSILDIGKTLLNQIVRLFTGNDDVDFNMEWLSNKVAEAIEWVRTKAQAALDWVLEFIPQIPSLILNFFTGGAKSSEQKSGIGAAFDNLAITIRDFILELPDKILGFIDQALIAFGSLWDRIYNYLIYDVFSNDEMTTAIDAATDPSSNKTIESSTKSKWDNFVEKLGLVIGNAFQELPVWIAHGIELAVAGITELIDNIDQWLVDAVDDKNNTSEVGKGVMTNAAENIEKGSNAEEPVLITAIKRIGKQIEILFTEILPPFINHAWEYISGKASGAWDSIKNIFNGTPQTEWEASIVNFGRNVRHFLEEELPKAITNAWEFIKGFIASLFKSDDNTELYDTFDQTLGAHNKRIKGALKNDDTGKTLGQTFVTSVKNGFQEAVKLLGPILLKALSSVLEILNDLGDMIFNALTGKKSLADSISEKFGNDKGLRDSLIKLGEGLKTFFMQTVPKLIGSAIGAIIREAPNWFGELFDGLNGALEKEADEQGKKVDPSSAEKVTTDTANSIKTNLFVIIQSLLGNPQILTSGAALLVSLFIIMEILDKLKDVVRSFNVMENYAEAQAKKNSIEAVMKKGITLIMMGLALAAFASQLDDKQMEKVEKVLGFIERIATLFMKVYGVTKGLGNASDMLENVKDIISLKKGGGDDDDDDDGDADGGILGALLGPGKMMATGAATYAVTELVSSAVEDSMSSLLTILARLGPAIDELVTFLASAIEKAEQYIEQAAVLIEFLGKALEAAQKCREIAGYEEDINKSRELISRLGVAIGMFAFNFKNELDSSGASQIAFDFNGPMDAVERAIGMAGKFGEFVDVIDQNESKFSKFRYYLVLFGSAVGLFSDIAAFPQIDTSKTISEEQINAVATTITALLENRDLASALASTTLAGIGNKLSKSSAEAVYSGSEILIIYAAALSKMAKSISGFDEKSGTSLTEFFKAIGKLNLSTAIGSKTYQFAENMGLIGAGLHEFAQGAKDLDEDDLAVAEHALTMISGIAKLVDSFHTGFLARILKGVNNLDTFALGIGSLSANLKTFMDTVDPIDPDTGKRIAHNMDNINSAMYVVTGLVQAAYLASLGAHQAGNINTSDLESITELAANLAEAIIVFISTVSDGVAEIDGETYNINSAKNMNNINTVMGIIRDLGETFYFINDKMKWGYDGDKLKSLIEKFGDAVFGPEFITGNTADQGFLYKFAWAVVNLDSKLGSIENSKLDRIKHALDILSMVVQMFNMDGKYLSSATTNMNLIFTALSNMTDDAHIEKLENGFNKLAGINISEENLDKVYTVLSLFKLLANAVTAFYDDSETWADSITPFQMGLSAIQSMDVNRLADGLIIMFRSFDLAIQKAEQRGLFTSTGNLIATMIKDKIEGAYAADMEGALQPHVTITPVFEIDTSDFDTKLHNAFTTARVVSFDLNAAGLTKNVQALTEAANNTDNQVDYAPYFLDIVNAIHSQTDQMASPEDVKGSLSNMTLTLDTGAIVGVLTPGIDRQIGNRIRLLNRGNSINRG